ncbi:hypothetical protein [Methylobacterium thuringiense]|uniref:hypothetical protein n=1 Tax=Methylobacterium thuringiense TaxID=1003091 RepID=UPI001EDE6790|nr:hypothetical protein [Methylobacterium thuringiense]
MKSALRYPRHRARTASGRQCRWARIPNIDRFLKFLAQDRPVVAGDADILAHSIVRSGNAAIERRQTVIRRQRRADPIRSDPIRSDPIRDAGLRRKAHTRLTMPRIGSRAV